MYTEAVGGSSDGHRGPLWGLCAVLQCKHRRHTRHPLHLRWSARRTRDWQPPRYHTEAAVNVISSVILRPPPLRSIHGKPATRAPRAHDFPPRIQPCSLLCRKYDKTLEAMLPLLMLLLLLFLPVLIKLGNPLSRQKRGERCFIIKEERDTPANIAPVNEKYSRVLQDLEISITWQSSNPPPPHPPCEEDNTTAPPPSGCSFLVFLAGRADCRCCLRDKCSSTAFSFSCCFLLLFFILFCRLRKISAWTVWVFGKQIQIRLDVWSDTLCQFLEHLPDDKCHH